MNTNQIKKFAIEARNILKRGVAAKITSLGFDAKGQVAESLKPQLMQGGTLWKGELYAEGFYKQWMALYSRVQQKGIQDVYEEAAYTWFNRLTAIRILQKNNLCEPVLVYKDSVRTPRIVDEARMGRLPQMHDETRLHLMELLEDDTKVTEQFAVLVTAWCHANPIMQACFGSDDDYTELLLPNNILAEGGFVDLLNHTDFITDEDFRSPELIGWLYQFYISERKDEVFAKKGKFEADEIPAATQIFTPNWIVKYMVQNTVGRIYLDNNPGTKTFTDKWKYLVDQKPTPSEDIYHYDELTDIKVADLACGSGHILNECFDILYDLYIYEGYSRGEAIENIFEHNLTGIDIDNRAKQLATFALMIKACQKDEHFVDAHCLPKVLTMPNDCNTNTWEELNGHLCAALGLPANSSTVKKEMADAFTLLQDAENLGSIMKFDISEETRAFMLSAIREMPKHLAYEENFKDLIAGFKIILALTDKYAALVMNPPYMGGGNMNNVLSKYVKDNYEDSKSDLFSVFMELAIDRLQSNGKYGMINMQSWMFLSSFEKLRKKVLDNEHIDSMFHLGPRTFDELSGEVVQNTAFVISKNHQKDNRGTYFRLVDGKNCGDKEQMFLFYSEQGAKIYYPNIPQSNFEKIPGCPIGYWVSEGMVNTFSFSQIGDMTTVRVGMSTSDSKRFLRLWFESDINKIGFGFTNSIEAMDSHKKWFPINKGGSFRKWYGNKEYVVNYQNDGDELKHWLVNNPNDPSTTSWSRYIRSPKYYFKPSLTWSKVSSSDIFSIRYSEAGSIFSDASNGIFMEKQDCLLYMLGILNSKLASNYIKVLSPTLNTTSGDICKVPYIEKSNSHLIDLINGTIIISKQDWDAHETSWDFQCNELVAIMHGSGALASPSQSQSQSPSQSLPSLDNAGLKPSLQPSLLASFLDRNAAVDVKKGHLPHWTQDGKLIFITFRLCDSLPQTTLNEYKAQKATWIKSHPEPWDKSTATEYARKFSDIMDTYLDNGYGECVLKNIDACKIVCDTIRKNAENKYDIISYVVMPNHVHILIRVINDTKLSEITQHWKGESAFRINKLLNRKSSLWMPESFDRIIRDETHLEYVLNYIKKNNDEGGIAYYDVHGGEALASLSNDTHVVDSAGLKPRLQPRLLEDIVKEYKQKWEDKFMRLHANEEELNRQFIEIYGLQDELTPDVPLSEITILQQGEISIEENNDNKESNE